MDELRGALSQGSAVDAIMPTSSGRSKGLVDGVDHFYQHTPTLAVPRLCLPGRVIFQSVSGASVRRSAGAAARWPLPRNRLPNIGLGVRWRYARF